MFFYLVKSPSSGSYRAPPSLLCKEEKHVHVTLRRTMTRILGSVFNSFNQNNFTFISENTFLLSFKKVAYL